MKAGWAEFGVLGVNRNMRIAILTIFVILSENGPGFLSFLCGFGWCFGWFATRRGWLVFCRGLGVLVGGGFALLAGFVYVSSLLPRGAAGRRVPAGFPCGCGGGLRTQERVLCYFTSHLIASGATPPRRWARGCREAVRSPCDVVVRHGCPSGRPCCLSFLSFV